MRDLEVVELAPGCLPERAHQADAGIDLRSRIRAVLEPWGRLGVPVGVAVAIDPGFVGEIVPRSGLALKHGVTVLNAPGSVDAGYRGEVRVILVNLSDTPYEIQPGDRIAQMSIKPVALPRVVPVEDLGETGRGAGGFGSTGR